MIFWFDIALGVEALLFPLFLLLAAGHRARRRADLRRGDVRYRDVPYAIPFVIQIWMFASPVFYSINCARERLPVAGRAQPDDRRHHRPPLVAARHAATRARVDRRERLRGVLLLVVGLAVFRSAEPRFADTI